MDLNIERGSIYEYIEKDGTVRNRVLIVADNSRSRDNILSALRLSPAKEGGDTVMVDYDSLTGLSFYVHCGCVSYVYRNRLGRKTGEVLENTMGKINEVMRQQLGLNEEQASYKKLYEDLVQRIVDRVEFKEPPVMPAEEQTLSDLVGDWDRAVDKYGYVN